MELASLPFVAIDLNLIFRASFLGEADVDEENPSAEQGNAPFRTTDAAARGQARQSPAWRSKR